MNVTDADILRTLGHPAVLATINVLLQKPTTLPEIATEVGLSASALAYHMRKLESVGLVTREHSHGPWRLVAQESVQDLLLTAAQVGLSIKQAELDQQRTRLRALRKILK
jgi:DNA-binding transcriptional regulator GbsR (MarR family)